MEYCRLFKNSFNNVLSNIVAYGLATLVLAFGSMLVITGPPLLYGFVLMLVKGANQEKVNASDVFDGFRSGNFVRSWVYSLFILAVAVLFLVVWAVIYLVLGISIIVLLTSIGTILPKTSIIALMILISIVVACIISIPGIFILFVLPLLVIKEYRITEALTESIGLVKENFVASTILCIIIACIALAGVLPYYAGLFLQWPMALNLSVYFIGIFLTMPLSHQILVNATIDLTGGESSGSSYNDKHFL
ncbi:hypothetical protein V7O62_12470 [Methanolobus sp. ZRKC2]|uniref:hypothetical protein n=1 Tax=Methanolobus sp. ZRKC2 TaxID=3125783 RepID=UPI003249D28B